MTTATTMALTELAEKGADVDVLRQMVHVWTRRLLQVLEGDEDRSARMYPACLLGEVVYTARSLDEIRALCP